MKHIKVTVIGILIASFVILLGANTNAQTLPYGVERLFGTWIDNAQYNEMLKSKSPYQSRQYLLEGLILRLGHHSSLSSASESVNFSSIGIYQREILLSSTSSDVQEILHLSVVNESMLKCLDCPFGNKDVVFNKFSFSDNTSSMTSKEEPFLWYFKKRYFNGEKTVQQPQNSGSSFLATFGSDSSISGFSDYIKYDIAGDWVGCPPLDILLLQKANGVEQCFHYKIENDTILVYRLTNNKNSNKDTMCESLTPEHKPSTLLYIITKPKP